MKMEREMLKVIDLPLLTRSLPVFKLIRAAHWKNHPEIAFYDKIKLILQRRFSMSKTVAAIYENGVFRPLKKVRLSEHQKVELNIFTEDEIDNVTQNALSIIGIGESPYKDTARKHDEYLYGKKRSLLKKTK